MSGSSSRRKGNRAETDVAAILRDHGWQAITSRAARDGTQGGADIITDFPMSVEVKNVARMDLSGWWAQAQEQAQGDPAVVIHKRRGVNSRDPEGWWVCMDLHTLLEVVRRETDGRT